MSRFARVVIPNCPHHITQRGVRSMNIFANDDDRIKYLNLLKEHGEKFGLAFLAYCLMSNHIHLVVIPENNHSLANALGEAHQHYTKAFNFHSSTKGYLFQGRFFSCPLDNMHTLAAIAYTERNPVRAGLVKNAWDYPWSSAMFHTNIRKSDPIVARASILDEITNWKSFLTKDPPGYDTLEEKIRSGRPCGEEEFIVETEKITGRSLHTCRRGRPQKK